MNGVASREDFLKKLRKSSEVEITVTGRKTKKKFSTPVWFALDGDRLLLVPVKGSDSQWFKDLAKDPNIGLSADKTAITAKATPVRNANQAKNVVERLKTKYKSDWNESYYSPRDVYVEVPL